MKNTDIKIRIDAKVGTAVALVTVPVMRPGIFHADPHPDRGYRHA